MLILTFLVLRLYTRSTSWVKVVQEFSVLSLNSSITLKFFQNTQVWKRTATPHYQDTKAHYINIKWNEKLYYFYPLADGFSK